MMGVDGERRGVLVVVPGTGSVKPAMVIGRLEGRIVRSYVI